jgi:hypothetical protein
MQEHAAKKWQRFFAKGMLSVIESDHGAFVLTIPSKRKTI